jgi:hypothetical protein
MRLHWWCGLCLRFMETDIWCCLVLYMVFPFVCSVSFFERSTVAGSLVL